MKRNSIFSSKLKANSLNKRFAFSIVLVTLIFAGCPGGNFIDPVIPENDGGNLINTDNIYEKDFPGSKGNEPELVLAGLTIKGVDAKNVRDIAVENYVDKIESDDVVAEFNYGRTKNEQIKVRVGNGASLAVGKVTTVILGIQGEPGKHRPWRKSVNIIRKTADDKKFPGATGSELDLKLESLKVHGIDVNLNTREVKVEQGITEVKAGNIEARFTYGAVTEKIEVKVEGDPVTLTEGFNTVKLSVEGSSGKYNPWAFSVRVEQKTASDEGGGNQGGGPNPGGGNESRAFVEVPAPNDYLVSKPADYPSYIISGVLDGSDTADNKEKKVKIDKYKIAKYEVTYEWWLEVCKWAEKNGYKFDPYNGYRYGTNNGDKKPVTGITWQSVIVWCNAYTEMTHNSEDECVYRSLNDDKVIKNYADVPYHNTKLTEDQIEKIKENMKKKGFRLPTLAEWEFAARFQGTDKTAETSNSLNFGTETNPVYLAAPGSISGAPNKFYTDNEGKPVTNEKDGKEFYKKNISKYAVTDHIMLINGSFERMDSTAPAIEPIGSRYPNKLGIFDMSGNVTEYVFDNTYPFLKDWKDFHNPVFLDDTKVESCIGGAYNHKPNISCVTGVLTSPSATRYIGFRLAQAAE